MKPGDLVILVNGSEEKLDDSVVGLHGVIVEPVTFDDATIDLFVRFTRDWWVLIDGELQPWAKKNLQVVNPDDGGYDNTKESK